ncbi:hypothetical protein LXL04_005180 [Taraxacum kok-saghyz]
MKGRMNWVEFSEECKIRFGPPMSMNPLGELTHLRQTSTVEDYCTSFETKLARTLGITPEQSTWYFCAGLKSGIRYEVEFARPTTLYYAMNLARQIEFHLSEANSPRFTGHNRNTGGTRTRDMTTPRPEVRNPTWKWLTSAEMADRRAKGLFFNCDELFAVGHKCAKLFCIMMTDEEDETTKEPAFEDMPLISLNAIRGSKTDQTFQVRARVGTGIAWVLLDSGSTHNFIAGRAAQQLQVAVEHRQGLRVALPDGGKMASSGISKELKLLVQGYTFQLIFFSIPLEGFDLVLGVRWLQQLGPIMWDFTVREMEFKIEGTTIKWHGESPDAVTLATLTALDEAEPNLELLLHEFAAVFEKPVGLPPTRVCDHRIRLLKDTEPIAVRPYRYPHLLKDEIEKQCTDMLQTGVIRPSQSPYSSPVLLVKKHDDTWRFYVDYRELNAKTIKDKFPIPVVDELLDELHGATIFTKLDLASGYHQIRMHLGDIKKTAFFTHHGHFEFLVIPFGLSNAPSTFQGLMNEVFRTQLRKYYRKFIKDYGNIASPLTSMLRRNNFIWSNESDTAFQELKTALSQAPVLALPNFDSVFVVDCDASGIGIGAVLQQQSHLIAFFSRKLVDRHHKLSTYERELIGLAKAVAHWRPYLWGRHFLIKTDHYSLKYLLEQRLTTSSQQHWVSKLLGFDFEVEYQAGALNQAADALSRKEDELADGHLLALATVSTLLSDVLPTIRHEINNNSDLSDLRARILAGVEGDQWRVQDDVIFFKNRLYLPSDSAIAAKKGWKAATQQHVRTCEVCQRNKWETLQPAGLLQPLPIPTAIWADISMDFVESLPKVTGKSVLLVVVDQFSKYTHFLALRHPYTAESVANCSSPKSFDCTGYRRQSCLIAIKCSKAAFGRNYSDFQGRNSRFQPLIILKATVKQKIPTGSTNALAEAQNRMKIIYDNNHRFVEYKEGDWVWLKLQPYRQLSVAKNALTKLSPKFYGPFAVLQRVGSVAYRLDMPSGSRIHNMFHVSLLKPHQGPAPAIMTELPPLMDGKTLLNPFKVLNDCKLHGYK